MVTPELITYIKEEFAKGKKREDVQKILVVEGGWSEADLNEAFRTVLPMQNFNTNLTQPARSDSPVQQIKPIQINPQLNIQNDSVNESIQKSMLHNVATAKITSSASHFKLFTLLFLLVAAGGLGATWFIRPAFITDTFNTVTDKVSQIELPSLPSFSSLATKEPENTVIVPPVVEMPVAEVVLTKNCGISAAPNLKKASTYEKNSVLNCLGISLLNCEDAEAILTDPLLPNLFQVKKDGSTCNFRMTYTSETALENPAGKSSAGKYVECTVSSIKAVDESKNPPVFSAPSTDNPAKYASQASFYATLGVFVENGLDQEKIQNAGCTGSYVSSLINSYPQ